MTTKQATRTIHPINEPMPNQTAEKPTDTSVVAELLTSSSSAVAEVVNSTDIQQDDPYMDESYSDPDATYPRIQVLRGEGGQKPCWFIPQEQLDRAGWLDSGAKLETYHFNSGAAEEGLMLYEPRLIVAAKTTVLAFDRAASLAAKRMVLCGDYNRIADELKDNYGLVQFFRLYLLDENNAPLAEMPFEFRAKGATRATFVKQWDQNCDDITRHHCRSLEKPFARRNAIYRSLCVFRPLLTKEKVETTKANVMAAKVSSHVRSTPDDWVSYFLGRNQNADWFTEVMDAGRSLMSGVRTDMVSQLPTSEELKMLAGR
jgi:hypothetical protein